jgi:2-polyprenyl-3-methyl-5-hydroxy-6-metoxy-1,4-benzoquinol methylase
MPERTVNLMRHPHSAGEAEHPTRKPIQSPPMMRSTCSCGGALLPKPIICDRSFQLLRCGACGLLNADPPPTLASFDAMFYEKNYVANLQRWTTTEAGWYQRWVAPLRTSGRLLDVGAGMGVFLGTLDPARWERLGVDPSPHAARIARDRLGVTVHQTTLEDFPPDGGFDVITYWNVLEALSDPVSSLRAARRHCRDDGFLVIKTADATRHMLRVGALLARAGRSRILFHPNACGSYFDRASLGAVLAKADFRVVTIKPYRDDVLTKLLLGGRLRGRLTRVALHLLHTTVSIVAVATPA